MFALLRMFPSETYSWNLPYFPALPELANRVILTMIQKLNSLQEDKCQLHQCVCLHPRCETQFIISHFQMTNWPTLSVVLLCSMCTGKCVFSGMHPCVSTIPKASLSVRHLLVYKTMLPDDASGWIHSFFLIERCLFLREPHNMQSLLL